MKKRVKINITKQKIKKGCKGAISIFLCLLLTPVMSIALGLVEYARYQEVLEITDEIYEITGVSLLSDYDEYIHDRFGLLATSQAEGVFNGASTLLQDNTNILGKQIELDDPAAVGQLSLANTEILRQQVVDFSELTSTTAILLDDFDLEELLNKLQGVQQFASIMNTVGSLADTADALTKAVDKLEELEIALNNLETALTSAVSAANTLSSEMAELYNKLGSNGVTITEESTLEQIEANVATFTSDYLQDFKDLFGTANRLVDSFSDLKSALTSVKDAASGFTSAVSEARTAVGSIASTNNVDTTGDLSSVATSTLEDVLEEMETLVNDSLTNITEETINTAKATIDEIINSSLNSLGISDIANRYYEIVHGDYFALPLTDTAKQDITELLKTVQSVYSSHNGDELTDFLKGKLVPNIGNINVSLILDNVEQILTNATATLKDKVGDSLISMLTDLVNIVKGLFDLDLFYEADMNAYLNFESDSSSPYQDFLNALGALFTAIEDFETAMAKEDFFSKLKGVFNAMKDMFKAIGDLLQAIMDIAGAAVDSIVELGTDLVEGDVQGLYEKLLISGYMRHNLPCRTDSEEYSHDASGNKLNLQLNGTGLTGFAFNDIPRPPLASFTGQSAQKSNFQGLATMMQNLKAGRGTDTMFMGAELEYIRAGTNSEIANQVICFFDLYFLRLLLDLPSIFITDNEVKGIATTATVASWVVFILYVVAEPFCDTLLLVNGETVPLIKTDCWLTSTGLYEFINKLGDAVLGEELSNDLKAYTGATNNGSASNSSDGIDYKTHMLIMLLIYVETDTQIQRLGHLIELEAAEYYRQKGKTFDMNKTYTAVQISGDVTFNPFFDLGTFNGGASFLPKYRIKNTVSY